MENSISPLAIIFQWTLDGLFPVKCWRCSREGGKICVDCADFIFEKAPAVCPFCHETDSDGRTCQNCSKPTFLDGATSLGFYHDKFLQKMIHAWKFSGDREAGQTLENWLVDQPLDKFLPPLDWYVASVPLHEAKFRERGFNQAEAIGRAIAKKIQSPYVELLKRSEWTEPQARRNADERQVGDLDGIFEPIEIIPPCVLLCDDVLTSGATMDAAAKILKAHGAEVVWGFTLARADH